MEIFKYFKYKLNPDKYYEIELPKEHKRLSPSTIRHILNILNSAEMLPVTDIYLKCNKRDRIYDTRIMFVNENKGHLIVVHSKLPYNEESASQDLINLLKRYKLYKGNK